MSFHYNSRWDAQIEGAEVGSHSQMTSSPCVKKRPLTNSLGCNWGSKKRGTFSSSESPRGPWQVFLEVKKPTITLANDFMVDGETDANYSPDGGKFFCLVGGRFPN